MAASNVNEKSDPKNKPTISHSEVEGMLTKCIDWFVSQEEVYATQILLLHQIQNIAAQKAHASKKLRKMTDYYQV